MNPADLVTIIHTLTHTLDVATRNNEHELKNSVVAKLTDLIKSLPTPIRPSNGE